MGLGRGEMYINSPEFFHRIESLNFFQEVGPIFSVLDVIVC